MLASLKLIAPLSIFILGIIVFFICLSGKVRYGLFFLVPLMPLQNVVEKLYDLPMGNNFNDILLLGMVFGWILSSGGRKGFFLGKSSLNILLFIWFIYTYLTLWHGSMYLGQPPPINPAEPRLQNWKNYMVFPLLFFLTANNLRNVADMKRMLLVMCASMFLMNFYNVQQVHDMGSWISRTKVNGTFVWLGANEVAAFYATYTFVLLGIFLFEKNKRWKILLIILILVNLYIDLFMFSRGGYLATLAAFLWMAFMRKKFLIIPIIVLVVFWQAILPKTVIERLTFSEEEGQLDVSAQTRLTIWEESFVYIEQSPIFGVGFNVFSHLGMQRDTHNIYLKTFAEQGIIGLIFLLIIYGISFKRALYLYARAADPFLKGLGLGFSACVLAVIVGNFFGDRWTHMSLSAFFWVFLGMVERGNNLLMEGPDPQVNSSKKKTLMKRYGE